MLLETLSQSFRKARVTNATDNGFPSRVPRTTEPTGKGDSAAQATASAVFDLAGGGALCQNGLLVLAYGTGSDNNTMALRVIGWRYLPAVEPTLPLWIPCILAELSCTLSSTPVGVAGATIAATELFADTLTLAFGNTASTEICSSSSNVIGHALIDLKGFQKVEFTFTTGGVATNCNALFALL